MKLDIFTEPTTPRPVILAGVFTIQAFFTVSLHWSYHSSTRRGCLPNYSICRAIYDRIAEAIP
ncbi:MAG: hypothetical protein ACPH26_09010, partial [Candidatus Puniceispirillaceae bacterium]